ncbi:uncharacterized protein LOC132464879 [Gadus macrocephalus]|uniref:uncharacterized protein LOC132464879 n=1 Tax=Gadus macrocephalus TaxID=80720 RepID=UPI0028CBB1AB|nr:uncharacterized protein LOC132464879 [Gadus macrocephalus]
MLATCWAQGTSGSPTIPARVMNRDTQALLDTGSVVTLLRPDLAGGKAGEPMEVACVHGDTRTYPTCHVVVRTTHGVFTIRAGIVPHLPVPLVIGRDCPIFRRFWAPALESRGRRDAVAVAARDAVAVAARDAAAVAARDAAGAAARGAAAGAARDAAAAAGDTRPRRDTCLGGSLVYLRLGQRVEECGIPPRKPRPGRARGTVKDGVYHPHPPAGDGEHPFHLPNQGDWGTPGRKLRSHLKRRSRTAQHGTGAGRKYSRSLGPPWASRVGLARPVLSRHSSALSVCSRVPFKASPWLSSQVSPIPLIGVRLVLSVAGWWVTVVSAIPDQPSGWSGPRFK